MTVRTTISMPDDVWASIERQQTDTGASVSEIVRRALVAYFNKGTSTKKVAATAKATTKRVPRPATVPAKRPSKRVKATA